MPSKRGLQLAVDEMRLGQCVGELTLEQALSTHAPRLVVVTHPSQPVVALRGVTHHGRAGGSLPLADRGGRKGGRLFGPDDADRDRGG